MKKKIITTILALGLLQGASIAHADTWQQRMGGTGHGNVFELNEADPPFFFEDGSMVVKLNGLLSKTDELGNGMWEGDAFVTGVILELGVPIPPIPEDTFPFSCTVTPADTTHHQIQVHCDYFDPIEMDEPIFFSDGQCYITKDDHDRVMACSFLYDIPPSVFGQHDQLFVPISFDIIR